MCTVTIIAARSKNNTIGNNNQLPWKLPSDLKHFKKLTENSVVVMGRKTYESIGKPLPKRLNVVISTKKDLYLPNDVVLATNPQEALKASRVLCLQHKIENIWIIGGAGVYQQFIKRADKMILTTIDKECGGDTLFPMFKPELWELISSTKHTDPQGYLLEKPDQVGVDYTIEEYERMF